MILITRQILANAAASRWLGSYFRNGKWHNTLLGDSKVKYDALIALGPTPNPDDVNRVIGNDSWTRETCSCCSATLGRGVSVDVTAGEYSTHICEECVDKMKALFL